MMATTSTTTRARERHGLDVLLRDLRRLARLLGSEEHEQRLARVQADPRGARRHVRGP